MKKPFFRPPANVTPQARNAFRVALVLLFSLLSFTGLAIYWGLRSNRWQFFALAGIAGFSCVLAAVAVVLSRRGWAGLGMALLIGGILAASVSIPFLVVGLGIVLAIADALMTTMVAQLTLPPPRAPWAILAGFAAGIAVFLLDEFLPLERWSVPQVQAALPVLTVAILVVFCVFVFPRFNNYTVRTKLIAAFVSVAVMSVGLVAFASDRVMRDGLTGEVGTNLKSLAESQAATVGDALSRQVDTLAAFSLNQTIRDAVEAANAAYSGDPATIQADLDKLDKQWRAADAVHNDADPLVHSILSNKAAAETRKYINRFTDNVEVFVTDKYGANVAAGSRTSDYYQADEDWWQAAYHGGQGAVYIGQPDFDISSGTLSVNMAIPVYAPDTREVIGILRTTYRVAALSAALSSSQFGQKTDAYLLFPDSTLLNAKGATTPGDPATFANLKAVADKPYAQFVFGDGLKLVSQASVFTIDPEEYDLIARLGWTIVIVRDPAEALQPISTATKATLVVSLGVMLLAGLTALIPAHFLNGPITRLTSVAEKVRAGDLTAQARIESNDEIGALAATFNRMTTQLRGTLENLGQRVADRTRDLALAAEIGQHVSAVRDLDALLTDAVETIRTRFDLYYTQIYLTNPGGTALLLRAGTGAVGQELLRRSHRLPVGPGSINGTAAIEKRPVLVSDTAASAIFRPNPLLPDTQSELSVPLAAGGHLVGVLDLQSAQPGAFTHDNLPAFQALAGQLAVAIENVHLFATVQQAREEVEAQARRQTRNNWQAFLNAVERSERLGFAYDQIHLTPLTEPLTSQGGYTLQMPIIVTGEPIGRLQLEDDPSRIWTADDAAVVETVARQVAQQVENLRLLAEAERYRDEAEQAVRRLTREGWEGYLQSAEDLGQGYRYDLNQMMPLMAETEAAGDEQALITQALTVQGEAIGELAVLPPGGFTEAAAALVAVVAERLSAHIENLRLTGQAQQRAAELEEATNFLDSVIENLPTMLFVKDAENLKWVRWNKAGEDIIGFNRNDLLGKSDYDFFPKDEADFFVAKDREVLAGGQLVDIADEPIQTAHKGLRYLHTRKVPVYGADGKPKYLLGISEDITERKQAEDALAKRATELETVAQVSTAAASVLEAHTLLQNVVDLTKASFSLYHAHVYLLAADGQTLSLAAGAGEVGRQMVAAGRSIPLDHEHSLVARAARTRQAVIVNDVRAEPDFLPHPLLPETRSEMAVPMIVGNRVLGVFDVQHDQAHAFTDEDVRIQTTLAAQVAVALQNANLFAEQAATVVRLRELDQLKSTFLANMSHELRTPLNSILGFTDVMLEGLDGPLTGQMDNDLKVIQKNGRHLLELINDVLDMAKIEAGKMNLSLERFDLHEVLEEVLELTGPLARERALELRIEPGAADGLYLEADRVRLRQVMINLVGNAIKFTEIGGITLRAAQSGDHLRLAIRDTGLGIPPDKLDTIFEAFNQGDASTTRRAGGTGLGLPISRRLIELHGGRLWAESTGAPGPQGGSTFFIELPVEAQREAVG